MRAPARSICTASHSSARDTWALVLVGFAALAVRLAPVLSHHALRGSWGYDEGVYFSASQELVAGQLPYRDFLFLQPPGIAVLLLPVAELSRLVPDSSSFGAARLLFIGIGVINTVLVGRLLRRFGAAAVVGGAGLYAVWTVSTSVEREILLEPLLNLALLGALLLVLEGPRSVRRVALAGAVLGSAAAVKLWAAPEIAAIALWLMLARGWRALATWLAAAVVAVVVWLGPFLVLTTSSMYDQVVRDQIERPSEGVGLVDRLRDFTGLSGIAGLDRRIPAWALLLGAALIGGALLIGTWRARDRAVYLWALLLVAQLAQLLLAPAFFSTYAAFAAPAVSLLAGVVIARVGLHLSRQLASVGVAAGIAVLALLAVSSFRSASTEGAGNSSLSRFMSGRRCVWVPVPSLLIRGNANLRQIRRDCPHWVDPYGHLVDIARGSDEQGSLLLRAPELGAWQAGVRAQLARSDAAVLSGTPSQQGFDARTIRLFQSRFIPRGRDGTRVYWVRRPSQSRSDIGPRRE